MTGLGGAEDQVGDRSGVGNHGGVGGVDLDGLGVHPGGHEALGSGGNRVVLVGHQVPRWDGLPGWDAGGLAESRERRRALGGGHHGCGVGGTVGAEGFPEDGGVDVGVGAGGAVGLRERPEDEVGRSEHAARELRQDPAGGFAGIGGEGGDVNQGFDVGVAGGSVGDDLSAVGVPDQDDGSGDGGQDAGDVGGVGGDAAQRVRRGQHGVAALFQPCDDPAPAGGVGEGAVDQDDGGLGPVAVV